MYGLAIAGSAGAREVIENMRADFELTMALAGCSSIAEIGPEMLVTGALAGSGAGEGRVRGGRSCTPARLRQTPRTPTAATDRS